MKFPVSDLTAGPLLQQHLRSGTVYSQSVSQSVKESVSQFYCQSVKKGIDVDSERGCQLCSHTVREVVNGVVI